MSLGLRTGPVLRAGRRSKTKTIFPDIPVLRTDPGLGLRPEPGRPLDWKVAQAEWFPAAG
jgi:hypothetical protein